MPWDDLGYFLLSLPLFKMAIELIKTLGKWACYNARRNNNNYNHNNDHNNYNDYNDDNYTNDHHRSSGPTVCYPKIWNIQVQK